jgi:hypothetical protein
MTFSPVEPIILVRPAHERNVLSLTFPLLTLQRISRDIMGCRDNRIAGGSFERLVCVNFVISLHCHLLSGAWTDETLCHSALPDASQLLS